MHQFNHRLEYKPSKVISSCAERVRSILALAQEVINRKEETPLPLEMDLVCSSLTILLSLQRLAEYYEGLEKEKGERNNMPWSEDENNILRSIVLPYIDGKDGSVTRNAIEHAANRLGRTYRAVREQVRKILHGKEKGGSIQCCKKANKRWTMAQLQWLTDCYATVSMKDMEKHLGKNRRAIYTKACQMGLTKSKARS